MNTKKNYIYNVLSELITTVISLVTMPYITRMLGTGGLGAYQYVLTIASYFVLFANCGVKAYGNRRIAQVRDDPDQRNRAFSGIFYQQAMLSLTVFVLYILFSLTYGRTYLALFAIFGINMISAILEVTWLFYGMEAFGTVAVTTVVLKVLSTVAVFLFVKGPDDLWLYALICSLSVIAVQLYLWALAHRYVRFVKVPFAEIRTHFLPCLALLLPMLAPTLFRSMDKLMLQSMVGEDSVGLYSAAEHLQTRTLSFITGLGTVMLPRISHMVAKGEEDGARRYMGLSIQFSMFVGCAFAFGISAVAETFVPYYYGESFADAISLTSALSSTLIFIAWSDVIRSQYIIPHQRDRIYIISVSVGTIINLVLNALLIPHFAEDGIAAGTLGAIPGTIAAEIAVTICQFLLLRRELPFGSYLRTCAIFPIAGVLMLLTVRAVTPHLQLQSTMLLLLAEVLIGAGVYLACVLIWYGLFRRDTLRLLFSFRKKGS